MRIFKLSFTLFITLNALLCIGNSAEPLKSRIDSIETYLTENPSLAIEKLKRIKVKAKNENHKEVETLALTVLGQAYINLGQMVEASQALDSAIVLADRLKLPYLSLKINSARALQHIGSANFNEAKVEIEKGLKLVNTYFPDNQKIDYYLTAGDQYMLIGKSTEALKLKEDCYTIAARIKNKADIASVLHSKGRTLWQLTRYTEALENYKQSLGIRSELNDTLGSIAAIRNIGLVYRDMGLISDSRETLLSALTMAKQKEANTQVADILNLLGSLSAKSGNHTEALGFYTESLTIREKLGLLQSCCVTLENISRSQKDLNLYEDAANTLNLSVSIRKTIGDNKGLASGYNELGSLFSQQGDLAEALKYYLLSLKIRQELGNQGEVAKSLVNIGITYRKLNSHANALKYFENALDLSNEITDPIGVSFIHIHKGNTLKDLNKPKEALASYTNALEIRKKMDNKALLPPVLRSIALAHAEMKTFSEAKSFLQQALELNKQLKDEKGLADITNELGNLMFTQQKYAEALNYFNEAASLFAKNNELDKKGMCLRKIGEIYTLQGNYKQSTEKLNEALALSKLTNNAKLAELTLLALYNNSQKQGKHQEALDFYLKFNRISDSLNSINQKETLWQVSLELEMGKKLHDIKLVENEVELLRSEAALKSAEIKRQKLFTNFMIALVSLLVLLTGAVTYGYFIFRNSNRKLIKSENELKHTIKTKDKLFSIIAHDLRSPFNALAGLTEVFSSEAASLNQSEVREYSQSVHQASLSLLTLIDNLLLWARSQTGKIELKPRSYEVIDIVQPAVDALDVQAKQKQIEIKLNIPKGLQLEVDFDTMNAVLRNLISNAIKFSNSGGTIKLEASMKDNIILIEVADNGIGISKENQQKIFGITQGYSTRGTSNESGSGLGLVLCKEFTERNGGIISVESQEEMGTKFLLHFSILK
jgi:signal transduction histidine kinase